MHLALSGMEGTQRKQQVGSFFSFSFIFYNKIIQSYKRPIPALLSSQISHHPVESQHLHPAEQEVLFQYFRAGSLSCFVKLSNPSTSLWYSRKITTEATGLQQNETNLGWQLKSPEHPLSTSPGGTDTIPDLTHSKKKKAWNQDYKFIYFVILYFQSHLK